MTSSRTIRRLIVIFVIMASPEVKRKRSCENDLNDDDRRDDVKVKTIDSTATTTRTITPSKTCPRGDGSAIRDDGGRRKLASGCSQARLQFTVRYKLGQKWWRSKS